MQLILVGLLTGAALRHLHMELAQCGSLAAAEAQVHAPVEPQVDQLDVFDLHEVDFHDGDVVCVQRHFSQVWVAAKQPAFDVLDVVVVGYELVKVVQVHENVFGQFLDSISAEVDDLEVVSVSERAEGHLLDLILRQIKPLQFLQVFEVAELNQPEVRFRHQNSFQVREHEAERFRHVRRDRIEGEECHDVTICLT